MITMLSNSLIQQHNVSRLACHITMKVVSEVTSCSMVGWGARAACAEVPTGSVEAAKANLGFGSHMAPGSIYGRICMHASVSAHLQLHVTCIAHGTCSQARASNADLGIAFAHSLWLYCCASSCLACCSVPLPSIVCNNSASKPVRHKFLPQNVHILGIVCLLRHCIKAQVEVQSVLCWHKRARGYCPTIGLKLGSAGNHCIKIVLWYMVKFVAFLGMSEICISRAV
jgi:hypothetical protein